MTIHTGLMRVGLLAIALGAVGCGRTLLKRADRTQQEGRLIGHDASKSAVQMRFEDGTENWILLDGVTDVDKPGTWSVVLGGVWIVAGLFALAQSNENGADSALFSFSDTFRTVGVLGLVGGAVLAGSGLYYWNEADTHLEGAGWTR